MTGAPVVPLLLLVDDDRDILLSLRLQLEGDGFRVLTAESGPRALELCRHRVPHLAVVDLMMPGMDGFEFLSELRKSDAWQSIPVVVLTSKDLSPEERRRLSGNVEKILQKGAYGREALLREVRRVVARYARCAPDEANKPAKPTQQEYEVAGQTVARGGEACQRS